MTNFFLLFLVASCCVLTSARSIGPNTVKIVPRTMDEDPTYIYSSVYKSYLEYQTAKKAGELGLIRADDHICYQGYGCFYKNGTYGNFWRLPEAPDQMGTVFYLYTSPEQEDPEALDYKNVTTILQSGFRGDWPTIFMIHGFGGDIQSAWSDSFKSAIFRGQLETNYIFVNWREGAAAPAYWTATANTQIVAVQIAKLIALFNTNMGTNSSSFHIIGHSLGAHVAGYTAHRLRELGHERVARITGLDPAGPVFEDGHSDAILSIGDADFVTGIHSNAAGLMSGGLGLFDRVGDIDFYPNGGQYQPGCPHMIWGTIGSILTFDWGNIPDSAKCNHNRALQFAIDSVDTSCVYRSYGCASFEMYKEGGCFEGVPGHMGIFTTNTPAAQPHYLITKDTAGYCAHPIKITLHLAATSPRSSGSLFVTLVGQNGNEETIEQMAEDEPLPTSAIVVEIVASKTSMTELTAIKITYEPECGWFSCSPDRILAEGITVDSLESEGNHLCSGFQVLYKKDIVTFPLTSCSTH